MQAPRRFAQYVAFLIPFFCTAAFIGFGIPAMVLSTALAAAYGGYADELILAYGPILLVPVLVVIAWVIRKKWPSNYAGHGFFIGSLVGVLIIVAIIATALLTR